MKTIRLSHMKINSFFILRCSAPFICHMSESDSSCAAAGTLVLVTRDARNNARAISTILSRGSREIESRKKFRGRPPKERVKNVRAHVVHPSLCIQASTENTRDFDILLPIRIFFSRLFLSFFLLLSLRQSLSTKTHPFHQRGKGMFYDVPSHTYMHACTPDIVGAIENNSDAMTKKKQQKMQYFLIRNSRARDMQISRRRPFFTCRFLCCVFARILASQDCIAQF